MNEAPDKNCYTLPNGDCIGVDCMHNQRDKSPIIGSPAEMLREGYHRLSEARERHLQAQVDEGRTRNLDVDRHPSYSYSPGSEAQLMIGPFTFWTHTNDGWGIAFSVSLFGVQFGWQIGREEGSEQ